MGYAFHFYAGTHMGLMARVREEAKLIPIFATEWGTSQASGDGGPYLEDAKTFLDFFKNASGQKISWAQWSLAAWRLRSEGLGLDVLFWHFPQSLHQNSCADVL